MKNTVLTIHGRCPSKKNSKQAFVKNGRMLVLPSKNYKEWHSTALKELQATYRGSTMESVTSIDLHFYAPDKRLYDLSNKAESIMDLLVDGGVLKDDNYEVVPVLLLQFMGVDKENPRCVISIHK